ncbi:protein kinase [Leifsonia sp. NPDC058230]|uniref:protein kinase domain-containing protein n=1 Tax=Leifsonia sp. NPDC058230 TaxID=3346391 RepID=UPI0036DB6DD5
MALHGEYLARPTYTFLHTIGEGSAGVCKVANHELFGGLVVQKTISLLGIPDAIARSEPRLLKNAQHEHIVEIWEAQFDPDNPAIKAVTFVTTYYAGGSIYDAMVEQHPFSTNESIGLIKGVLEALEFLHGTKRILHRDIKPANVLLNDIRDFSYVGDLGSAASMAQDGTARAEAGSPLYAPPEYVTGTIDARADLYSTGVILLELLNGRFPYESLDRDKIDQRLAKGQRSLPDKYFKPAPWVPRSVSACMRNLVSADPDERYASAAEALRHLNRLSYVSWQRTVGADLAGQWQGRWPASARMERTRQVHVTVEPITNGRYKGMLSASAEHRVGTKPWRGYAKLTRRIGADDATALSAFFRDVEAAAQAMAVR